VGGDQKNAAWAAKVGRATRSPGQYKIEWDGLDDKNKPLPQGTYTIYFEVNREFGDHETQKVQIDCGKAPAQQKIPESAEADETVIAYGPASS
jgi:thiamine biosynthesis lipoprotein